VIALAGEPTTWDTIVGTGGWIGTLGILAFIGKQLVDSWLAHRANKRADRESDEKSELGELTAGVGNASTVNAIMVKSVETLAAENERLVHRVAHLEGQVADRDLKIEERDKTIEQLKERVDQLVSTGQALSLEITNYQKLLREQEDGVN
jgi:regulator of replication initiation timing